MPADFIVGNCNQECYDWLMSYPTWSLIPDMQGALISGENFSGKTHLCHVFRHTFPHARMLNGSSFGLQHPFDIENSLVIIDDADCAPQPWLFHLYNHMKSNGHHLILTSTSPYQNWCTLKDLSSRLATMPHYTLTEPDDYLLTSLLNRKLLAFGIRIDDATLTYLIRRIERSYSSIDLWANRLNKLSAQEKKTITPSFIRKIINFDENS